MRQHMEVPLLVVLEWNIHAPLSIARTDWIPSLEKIRPKWLSRSLRQSLIQSHRTYKFPPRKKMLGQVRSLVNSQIPDTDVLVKQSPDTIKASATFAPWAGSLRNAAGTLFRKRSKKAHTETRLSYSSSPSKVYPIDIREQHVSNREAS